MAGIFTLLAASLVLAYCSQKEILTFRGVTGRRYDVALIALIVMLSLFCGLRTNYNDTGTYIAMFLEAPTWVEFWASGPNLLGNPGYYLFQTIFRHSISDNYHLYLLTIAFFITSVYVTFIRRYSENFTFSILLFFSIGLYISEFAALKQHIAMAILMLALPQLLKKRYATYYVLVFMAMLFHTYALLFVIVPLFLNRPWTKTTYLTVIVIVAVLFTFESSITSLLTHAENLGKEIAESEVFDTASINLFRLAVYAVLPALSFVFQRYLNPGYSRETKMMVNMSILSFLVMSLGLASGANLFSRCAIYYEIGTIVVFPWVIWETFNQKSYRIVLGAAAVCYLLFFYMDISTFAMEYRAISVGEFFTSLF